MKYIKYILCFVAVCSVLFFYMEEKVHVMPEKKANYMKMANLLVPAQAAFERCVINDQVEQCEELIRFFDNLEGESSVFFSTKDGELFAINFSSNVVVNLVPVIDGTKIIKWKCFGLPGQEIPVSCESIKLSSRLFEDRVRR